MYKDHQNTRASVLFYGWLGGLDSNTQRPLSFYYTPGAYYETVDSTAEDTSLSFHHRRPTKNLPLKFLTVQKSKDKRIVIVIKARMNESVKMNDANT